eukprot:6290454-Amphidinium_carterae.1
MERSSTMLTVSRVGYKELSMSSMGHKRRRARPVAKEHPATIVPRTTLHSPNMLHHVTARGNRK